MLSSLTTELILSTYIFCPRTTSEYRMMSTTALLVVGMPAQQAHTQQSLRRNGDPCEYSAPCQKSDRAAWTFRLMSSCSRSNASSSVSSRDPHPSSGGSPFPWRSARFLALGSAGSKPDPALLLCGVALFFGRGIRLANARPLLRASWAGSFRAQRPGAPRRAAAAVSELILRRFAENSLIRSVLARCVRACRRWRLGQGVHGTTVMKAWVFANAARVAGAWQPKILAVRQHEIKKSKEKQKPSAIGAVARKYDTNFELSSYVLPRIECCSKLSATATRSSPIRKSAARGFTLATSSSV